MTDNKKTYSEWVVEIAEKIENDAKKYWSYMQTRLDKIISILKSE